MASLVIAQEIPTFAVGEVNNVTVSFVGVLEKDELLTGVPTVVELSTSDLTISNQSVNGAVVQMGDHIIPVGKAVQFKCLGQTGTTQYTIKVTALTDSTPAQTKVRGVKFDTKAVE